MARQSITAVAVIALLGIAACESNGNTRYTRVASVGTAGPAGEPGPAGPAGPAGVDGAAGPAGPAGPQGDPGGNFTLGEAGMIATGGLVGPSGLGGTGLLANLGDPSTTVPVASPAVAGAGSLVAGLSGGVDSHLGNAPLPESVTSLASAVTGTLTNTGNALVDSGTSSAPLVDGVTSAVSPIITASLGGASPVGNPSDSSLLGVSVLSPVQQPGTLLEAGVLSDGALASVDLVPAPGPGLTVGSDLPAPIALPPVDDDTANPLDPVTSGVTSLLGGLGGP